MSGKIFVPLSDPKTIDHLDPRTSTHQGDWKRAREQVLQARVTRLDRLAFKPRTPLQHPCVGLGLCFGADWRELSIADHKLYLQTLGDQHDTYLCLRADRPGTWRRRKPKQGGLHAVAVTLKPWHAMALSALEGTEYARLIKPLLLELLQVVAEEFTALSGLPVVGAQVHPEEGMLHFHLSYLSIDKNGRLLWETGERGWHGLKRLRQGCVGALRQMDDLVRTFEEARFAVEELRRLTYENFGDPPVNYEVSLAVDAWLLHFSRQPGISAYFEAARQRHAQDVKRAKELDHATDQLARLKSMQARVSELEDRLEMQDAVIAELKRQLPAPAISPPPVIAGKSGQPPLGPR